jgi:hypothetical protein
MSREAGIRSIPVRGMYLSIGETPNQICGDRFDQQVAKPGRVVGDGMTIEFIASWRIGAISDVAVGQI